MLWQNYAPLPLKQMACRREASPQWEQHCKTAVSPQYAVKADAGSDPTGSTEGLRGTAFQDTILKSKLWDSPGRSSNVPWLVQLNERLCRSTGCLHPNVKEKSKNKNLVSSQKAPTLEFSPLSLPNSKQVLFSLKIPTLQAVGVEALKRWPGLRGQGPCGKPPSPPPAGLPLCALSSTPWVHCWTCHASNAPRGRLSKGLGNLCPFVCGTQVSNYLSWEIGNYANSNLLMTARF